jgi:hypothetical protein
LIVPPKNQILSMTHQHHYNITGIKHNGDLEKIKEALSQHPIVKGVETTLTPATVTITVEKHPDDH